MLVSRRTFRQPTQVLLKFRTFSSKGDNATDAADDDDDDAPVKKKSSKSGSKKNKQDMDGMNAKQQVEVLQAFYDASEAALKYRPNYSEEEKKEHFRIGRTYNVESFKRHNRDGKDYATKCWLASEALKSMRPDLKVNAMIIDATPPPKDRPWPIYSTPPIKGFRLKDHVKKSESTSEFVFT